MSHTATDSQSKPEGWTGKRGERWREHLGPLEKMLSPVHGPLFRALRLRDVVRVAEVGSGGGETARALLDVARSGTVVHGFDISPALVEAASHHELEGKLSFSVQDMSSGAPEAPYDRLISRFGVMFFDDDVAAFRNLRRWLKPDGSFAFAVWGPLRDNRWLDLARESVASVVEVPPFAPDAPGPFRYADAATLLAKLGEAGWSKLALEDWRERLPVGGGLAPREAAAFALKAFAKFAALLDEAGDRAYEIALDDLTKRYEAEVAGGIVAAPSRVHIVTGRA